MEGTHGHLGARLPDALGSEDPGRFVGVHAVIVEALMGLLQKGLDLAFLQVVPVEAGGQLGDDVPGDLQVVLVGHIGEPLLHGGERLGLDDLVEVHLDLRGGLHGLLLGPLAPFLAGTDQLVHVGRRVIREPQSGQVACRRLGDVA